MKDEKIRMKEEGGANERFMQENLLCFRPEFILHPSAFILPLTPRIIMSKLPRWKKYCHKFGML
jgi:hypothetical protein